MCKFLDSRARQDFPMVRFNHEEYQGDRRSVDLSASPVERMIIGARLFTVYDLFLVLEGKRLPPPSRRRESESTLQEEKITEPVGFNDLSSGCMGRI